MAKQYQLRCNLTGHEKDVRALVPAMFPENGLISGSRDNTSCIWAENLGSNSFVRDTTMRGHSNFVSSLCIMPPDDTFPQGLIITGSNDKTILAYPPGELEPAYKLTGHTGNVCALASGKFGFLLSGSWDTTARVWLNQKCVMTLEGHQLAVWAVGIISGQGIMLTGSADKTIKAWKAGKCVQTYKGHEDCVRGLAVVNEGEFLSCANDATVRRWAVESGDTLAVYYGHTNYVYSLCILPNGTDFATCGEDRTLRVWKGGELAQTLYHPCESVWTVAALPNGDIATGASDGLIRVFTAEASRVAAAEVLQAHEASLASAPVAAQPLGDIKPEDLPGPDSLTRPGKKDGQTTMVNTGKGVEVHQWDAAHAKWLKVGEVVGSSGGTQKSSGKTLYEGQEYDYVFSVDVVEGAPPLKLPFNISEDPWMAAQKFLHKHNLSQLFLDQVANFIVENTKGVTLGTGSALSYSDPFTGGDRYVPGSDKDNGALGKLPPGGSDPFTGGGRYIPEGQESKPASNPHFPVKTCLFFDNASPAEQIISKLKEFNGKVDSNLQVSSEQLDGLGSLVAGTPSGEAVKTLDKLLGWPSSLVFPALDVLRLALRDPGVSGTIAQRPGLATLLAAHAQSGNPAPCRLLALRSLANLMRHQPQPVMQNIEAVCVVAASAKDIGTKAGQVAAATLLLDVGVTAALDEALEPKSVVLRAVCDLLSPDLDPEAAYRLVVCGGSLCAADPVAAATAASLGLPQGISRLQDAGGKLGEATRALAGLLS